MNRKFNKKDLIIVTLMIIFIWSFIGSKGELVENVSTPIALGMDIDKKGEKDISYKIPIAIYVYENSNNITSRVITGTARTIGDTRENRQVKNDKKYLLGLEKMFVTGEETARYGMGGIMDILVHNPQINDRATMIICKGKAEDTLKYEMKEYANSAEFIYDMIKNSKYFNFFPQQYTIMDLIVRIDAEGRNSVLPYVELKEKGPEITGVALLKRDKMVAKADIEEAKIINLLKENKVRGMLDIQKSPKEYINYYAKSNRKVQCYKKGEKYKFVINLNLNGTIESNELYKNLNKDTKVLKEFTRDMENSVKNMCENFISKSKCEYNVDFLDLGRIAAAKYGRESGVDWNKVVCDSDIEVNVKVKVEAEGRGKY